MAQLIIIPAHTVSLTAIKNSIPGGQFKKLYFQCALTEIRNNGSDREAHFTIIVYAGKRKLNRNWKVGNKVECQPDPMGPVSVFTLGDEPVAFGNNEFEEKRFTLKQKKGKSGDAKIIKQSELMKAIQKILKDKKLAPKAMLKCEASLTQNPHVTYTVTLDDGTNAAANPSPPADPI